MTLTVLPAGVKSKKQVAGFIKKSLRLRRSAGGYLSRTAGAGNQQIMTLSFWFKRGVLGVAQYIFGSYSGGSAFSKLYIESTNQIGFADAASATNLLSTQVFRDPSAWYHIVVAIDTTQATAANRVKFYVNNVQITAFASATYPAQNTNLNLNSAVNHTLFNNAAPAATNYTDGYLAETNFVNAQQLTPSSFGVIDPISKVWTAKKYAGTYGTNGFHLNFEDNSTITALGYDSSGNNNHWTPNNISLSGVTYDSMTDVPTLTSATAANFAVINPIVASANNTVSNGNLTYVGTAAGNRTITLTGAFKQYGEITIGTGSQSAFGLATPTADLTQNMGLTSNGLYGIYDNGGTATGGFYLFSNGTTITSMTTQTSAGVVFQLAYDATGGKLWIGKNNVWYDSALGTTGNPSAGTNPTLSGLAANLFMFVGTGNFATITYNCNFGQRPFTYTPPTGFVALNTFNLPATGTVTMTGTFTGNANADGPFVWLNGTPTALTINGNAVTWGTHADKLANGFKVRTAAATHNAAGNNTYVVTTAGNVFKEQLAQTNP